MATASAQVDVDLSKAGSLGDGLLTELQTLRAADPLHWSSASRCWIVTGHAEVAEGFSGQLPLSSHQFPMAFEGVMAPEEQRRRIPASLRYISRWVTNLDAPDHTRIRKLLVKAFNRKVVESVRPYVQQRVRELLDEAERAPQVEFNEGIARLLPGGVILRLLGMPQTYQHRLKDWATAFTVGLGSNQPKPEWLDRVEATIVEMVDAFTAEIDKKRREPQHDLITELLNATEEGDRLSLDEMLGALQLIVVAGHETTSGSLTLGLNALARHPQQWRYLRDNPGKALDCVNELMRYSAMSTAIPRLAATDFDWRGRQIRRGDLVMLMQAAGNRDPCVFADPEVLDFTRSNDAAVTFGPGMHHCIGHLLAKMQLTEFFSALVQRFDAVDILDEEPDFMPQIVFRGLYVLNVRFHPRRTGG